MFSGSGYKSGIASNETIALSPRGGMLLDQLFRNTILLEIMIDDVPVWPGFEALIDERPAVIQFDRYPTRHNFIDTLKWLEMFFLAERHGLEKSRSQNAKFSSSQLALFGGRLISGHFGDSLLLAHETFYKNVCSRADKKALSDFLALCADAAKFYG